MLWSARENGVAGQSAAVKYAVGKISDEPAWIAAFDSLGDLYSRFHRVVSRYFKQDDSLLVHFSQRLNFTISGCKLCRHRLLSQGKTKMLRQARFITC